MKKMSLVMAGLLCSSSLFAGVVATFNGGQVTDEDLAPFLAQYKISSVSALPKEAKEALVKDVVAKKLLAVEAKKAGLEKDARVVGMIENAKEMLLAQAFLAKKFDEIKISDAEIKKYYNEHLADFKVPEVVKTAHILVEKEADAKAIAKELKPLKGDALKKKFAELAKEKSSDKGSAKSGGELPYMSAQELVPEYFNAARKLKAGEVSAPVKSQFGYHIILGQDHKAERQGSLEEAKAFIENGLKNEKHREMVSEQTKKLVNAAKISIK